MDRLTDRFLFESLPRQCLLLEPASATLYRRERGEYRLQKSWEGFRVEGSNPSGLDEVLAEIGDGDLGVLLGPAFFIFNILDFQRLPRIRSRRDEMVTWRLGKVFPEDLAQYTHRFFSFGRKRVLSVLVRQELLQKIRNLFPAPRPLIGSSTLTAMNFLYHRPWTFSRRSPHLMIQVAEGVVVVTAHKRSIPFYIRKFKLQDSKRLVQDISQVKNYLIDRYSCRIETFCMVTGDPHHEKAHLEDFSRLGLTGRLFDFASCLGGIK